MRRPACLAVLSIVAALLAPATPASAVDAAALVMTLDVACDGGQGCVAGSVVGDGSVSGVLDTTLFANSPAGFYGAASFAGLACEVAYTMAGILYLGIYTIPVTIVGGYGTLAVMQTSAGGLLTGASVVTKRVVDAGDPLAASPCLHGDGIKITIALAGTFTLL